MVSGQARPAGGLPFLKLAWNPWSVRLHLGPAACTPLRLSLEQGLVVGRPVAGAAPAGVGWLSAVWGGCPVPSQ